MIRIEVKMSDPQGGSSDDDRRQWVLVAVGLSLATASVLYWWGTRNHRSTTASASSSSSSSSSEVAQHKAMELTDVPQLLEEAKQTFRKGFLAPFDASKGIAPERDSFHSPSGFTTTGITVTESLVQGVQLVGMVSHRFNVSGGASLFKDVHPCAGPMLRSIAGTGGDEFFFAARDVFYNGNDIVNGSCIFHARILRGNAVRDDKNASLQWKSVPVLEKWVGPSAVLQCSICLASAMDITESTRRNRAPWGADVRFGTGETRNRAVEWHVRAFDVSLLWVVMSNEFGDVLVKPRHLALCPATLWTGNGDPVFALNLVENYLIVGCLNRVTMFKLHDDDGSVVLMGSELLAPRGIISFGVRAPLNVWMVTSHPQVHGMAFAALTERSSVLPGEALPTLDMVALLPNDADFPLGKAISCVAPHPSLENVLAVASYGGWCAIVGFDGAASPPQVYQCQGFGSIESNPIRLLAWNPVLSHILAFGESGNSSIIHIVDVKTRTHQVVSLKDLECIHGIDWCPSGSTLFVLVPGTVVEMRLSPANLSLKDWATLY